MDFISDRKAIADFITVNFDKSMDFVPSPDIKFSEKSYCFLNPKEMDYYFGWRTCVRNGNYPDCNGDMIRFFFRELLVMEQPIETIEKWARLLSKVYKGTPAGDMACSVIVDCCLYRMEWPEFDLIKHSESLGQELALAGPRVEIDKNFLFQLLWEYYSFPDGFVEFFSRFLGCLSESLWKERDIGIIEYLSNKRGVRRIQLFSHIWDENRYTILADVPLWNHVNDQRFENIAKYCLKNFPLPKGKKPSNVEEIVETSLKTSRFADRNYGSDSWFPNRTMAIRADDGRFIVGPYSRKNGSIPFDKNIILYDIQLLKRKKNVDRNFRKDLDRMIDSPDVKECPYIPSSFMHPSVKDLDEGQKKFYLYWRLESIKGRYHNTDIGYVNLRMAEIILCENNIERAMEELRRLAETYEHRWIKEVCMSYAIEHSQPLPDYGDCVDDLFNRWKAIILADALKKRPVGKISASVLYTLANIKPQYQGIDDELFSEIACRILNDFDNISMTESGHRLCERATIKQKKLSIPLYSSLIEYGIGKSRSIVINEPTTDKVINERTYVSAIVATRYVCKRYGCTAPKLDAGINREIVGLAESFIKENPSDLEQFTGDIVRDYSR